MIATIREGAFSAFLVFLVVAFVVLLAISVCMAIFVVMAAFGPT